MRRFIRRFIFAGLLLLTPVLAKAQQPDAPPMPNRGFVWSPPDKLTQAQRDLYRMKKMGAQAVRTTPIQREPLLTLADTLGLQVYQELPVDYFSARRLRDSLREAAGLLNRVLRRAQGHPSARRFGLARHSESSDTLACEYYRALSQRVHKRGPAGSQSYYLTAFPEADRCADAVDFVLLDALNLKNGPVSLLKRWYKPADSTMPRPPAGIGALGTRRVASAAHGLRQPGSPQRQARYLEKAFRALFADTLQPKPLAVFVYRWRDITEDKKATNPAYGGGGSKQYEYGLVDADSAARPAFEVVEGFFSGKQETFAFASGPPLGLSWPWLTLMAWGTLLLIGLALRASTLMQRMMPRYFRARGFYREAIREGRISLTGIGVVLLITLPLAFGIFGSAALNLVSDRNLFVLLVHRLRFVTPGFVTALLPYPWLLALVLGGFAAAVLAVWALFLSALSVPYYTLNPAQTLVLVLGPCWSYLLLMFAALVIATLPYPLALIGLTGLVVVACLVAIWSTLRAVLDVRRAAHAPPWVGFVAALVSPLVVLVVLAIVLAYADWSGTAFLWHLALRSP